MKKSTCHGAKLKTGLSVIGQGRIEILRGELVGRPERPGGERDSPPAPAQERPERQRRGQHREGVEEHHIDEVEGALERHHLDDKACRIRGQDHAARQIEERGGEGGGERQPDRQGVEGPGALAAV